MIVIYPNNSGCDGSIPPLPLPTYNDELFAVKTLLFAFQMVRVDGLSCGLRLLV